MAEQTIYALGASQITVSDGEELSGWGQGEGTHLVGKTLTLNSDAYQAIVITDDDDNFADNDSSQRLAGAQEFDGVSYAGGRVPEAEYELTLEDPDGNSYTVLGFNIREPGMDNSYGTVEGLSFVGGFPPTGVPLTVTAAREGPSYAYSDLAAPPCFVVGSLIDTPIGPVPVEALVPGDTVNTLDHGAQPVRWVGRVTVPAIVLRCDARFRPVALRRGSLGPGVPCRDMRLSQQHRVLVSDWRAELFFGEAEVLVPVHKLVGDSGIRLDHSCASVTYIHLLFDRHEIIRADGLLSESFLPGTAPDCPTMREIARLFPALAAGAALTTAARPCVQDRCARLLG